MKILSIDIGIKNLALCIMNTDNNIILEYWDVINLCDENTTMCNYLIKSKICNKPAKFFKNDKYFCKCHSNKSEYKLLTTDFNNYKRMKINNLLDLLNKYEIEYNKKSNKESLIKCLEQHIQKEYLEEVNNKKNNANDINLVDIAVSIKKNLDKINLEKTNLENIDKILIENQIGPIATRMKSIQGMITQYFVQNNISNINFISSANKLKLFDNTKNITYSERKKIGIEYTKDLLNKYNIEEHFILKFNSSKKKDDLADSFLQGYWYIINSNIINN